jgi:hypothetical protein
VTALLQWDWRRKDCLGFGRRPCSFSFLSDDMVMSSGVSWRESRPVVGDLTAWLPSSFIVLAIKQAAVRFFQAANMSRAVVFLPMHCRLIQKLQSVTASAREHMQTTLRCMYEERQLRSPGVQRPEVARHSSHWTIVVNLMYRTILKSLYGFASDIEDDF